MRFGQVKTIMNLEILLCSMLIALAKGSTHWVVTEEGKVQEKAESPFALNQPHDLMAFMKQEVNYEKMKKIKKVLSVEKKRIEDNEDKDLNLEERHYANDEDCIAAGKYLGDFNPYVSTILPLENKDIEVLDFIELEDLKDGGEEPDCSDIQELPPGSIIYDSLEGVVNREYLTRYQAEPALKTIFKYVGSEKEFAQAVTTALNQNSSSWVAYNLAASYWRVKGDAEKAMECVRRAIYYSPPAFLDVALLSLANILHRSRYTINATVVLENALEVAESSVIHFALGCVYKTLGEDTLSVEHFGKAVADQPDFKAAKERLHSLRCQQKLQEKMQAQFESLQRTLKDLEAYRQKHKIYVEQYHTVEKMQLSRMEQSDLWCLHQIYQAKFDPSSCKLRLSDESRSTLICNCKRNLKESEEDDELIPNIVSGKHRQNKQAESNDGDKSTFEGTKYAVGGAETFINRPLPENFDIEEDWEDANWPTPEICKESCPQTIPWDQYPSSYVNLESRGFSMRDLLTTYIGVKSGEDLPEQRDELNCEYLESVCEKTIIDSIPGIRDRHSGPMHKPDGLMKSYMLHQLEEMGVWPGDVPHLISRAIKKSLAQKDKHKNLWLLYNIAGLYFRVVGDNLKAVECIRRSLPRTPYEHIDVPLVNAANILYRLGRIDDAKIMLTDALKMNDSEPATYLALGNVMQAKGNLSGAVMFYEYGLIVAPLSKDIFFALLSAKCSEWNDKMMKEKILGKDYDRKIKSMEKASASEEAEENTHTYSVNRLSSVSEPTGTECENSSEESNLVIHRETTMEEENVSANNEGGVIKQLSNVAEDGMKELGSSARKIMTKLSRVRDDLESLMKEASSTFDSVSSPKTTASVKQSFTSAECAHALRDTDLRMFIVSATNVNDRGYDFTEELSPAPKNVKEVEPFCHCSYSLEGFTVDGLDTVINKNSFVNYDGEFGMETLLRELLPLSGDDFSDVAYQLTKGLEQHPTSWRLAYLSSYYWRLKGKARQAIDCLRLSLKSAPVEMRDVVLLGLANIFAHLRRWKDAIFVTKEAIVINPEDFLCHFTLANILAAMGDTKASIPSFRRALELQPELQIAQERYKAAVCETQESDV